MTEMNQEQIDRVHAVKGDRAQIVGIWDSVIVGVPMHIDAVSLTGPTGGKTRRLILNDVHIEYNEQAEAWVVTSKRSDRGKLY